jgi:signal transduction histidine kinase
MKKLIALFSRYSFKKRYEIIVLFSISLAGVLIVLLLYLATLKYTSEYTRNYWQAHTNTFSNSIKYGVILNTVSIAKKIVHNFSTDQSILKASVYLNNNQLLATSGHFLSNCTTLQPKIDNYIEYNDLWCFYSHIYHDEQSLGYVELIVSKHDLQAFMDKILLILILIVLLVLIFFFFSIQKISSIFTVPMSEIVTVLKGVNNGIRGNRVPVSGPPDILHMKQVLNEMLSKIENNEQILEQTVDNRTNELKIALESSNAANNYKNQIISMVSHEMKTPLHSIGNYLELIYEKIPKTSEFDICVTFYNSANLRVQDLNNLINKVLFHGKLEAQKFELSINSFEIKELIQEIAYKLDNLYVKKNNHLSLRGDNLVLNTDSNVLGHIISNLLENAYKFTDDGKITVSWLKNKDNFFIQVEDTGCGIDNKLHSQIFNPFWQADMSLTREHGGHGLGLSIVKQFVDLLRGKITITSSLEKGTIFRIIIPL